MTKPQARSDRPDISIGPHPAREGWRVLRVAYPASMEGRLRIGAAIDCLLGPPPAPRASRAASKTEPDARQKALHPALLARAASS